MGAYQSDNNFYEKNRNKEVIKKRFKTPFGKKWDPESSSGWRGAVKKNQNPFWKNKNEIPNRVQDDTMW